MRTILFRGKDVHTKEWRYGGLIDFAGDGTYFLIVEPYPSASTLPLYTLMKDHAHFVTPDTIGQYTGLKDKNGKRIFEGDIVKRCYTLIRGANKKTIEVQVGVVRYRNSDCGYWLEHTCNLRRPYPGDTIEVIGNIHDNPELIGEHKDTKGE